MRRKKTDREPWPRARIKYELAIRGHESLRELDLLNGLPVGTVSSTLSRPDPRGEQVISDIIGLHPSTIWPHRYDPKGHRLKPQPEHQIRAAINARHRQNGRAA